MMEQRNIILDNRNIPYEIHYKKIKNCYLRVEQGKIKISTSDFYSIEDIENLIIKNKQKILQQIDHYQNKVVYQNNGYVYIFNQKYKLIVRDLKINKCVIHDQDIYIYTSRLQETLDMFLKELLYQYARKRIEEYLMRDFDLKMPEIQIKKMKSRWGACYYLKNKICLSLNLIHLEQDLIDYVIVHELCHFLEANHSKTFYHEIEKRIPDYRLKEKRLKENT